MFAECKYSASEQAGVLTEIIPLADAGRNICSFSGVSLGGERLWLPRCEMKGLGRSLLYSQLMP